MNSFIPQEEIKKEIMAACSKLEEYIDQIKEEISLLKQMNENLEIEKDSEIFFKKKCDEFKKQLNTSPTLSTFFIPFYKKPKKAQKIIEKPIDMTLNEFSQSKIIKSTQQKDLTDELQKIHLNLLQVKLLFSVKLNDANWKVQEFYEKVKGWKITTCIIKTLDQKVLGCYSPMEWKDYGAISSLEVTGGHTFAFYFQNDILKVCKVKPGEKTFIQSSAFTPICLYGSENHTNTLSIAALRNSKNPDFARIRGDSHHGYPDLPEFKTYTNNLFFAYGKGPHFKAEELEVYGLQLQKPLIKE